MGGAGGVELDWRRRGLGKQARHGERPQEGVVREEDKIERESERDGGE